MASTPSSHSSEHQRGSDDDAKLVLIHWVLIQHTVLAQAVRHRPAESMAPVVTVTDVTYVAAPAGALPPEPIIKLNAMEAQWVVVPLLQHLLLFEGDRLPPFDAILRSLRSSLAATLATHGPLSGKLHYLADTGDVAICRSTGGGDDDRGVRFVAAECDADVRHLAGDEDHDVLTFERLVPELDMTLLPAPVLAVQATRFAGGGVALGVSVHHAVADGRSLWRFVEAWAAVCRGDTPPSPPVFDRSRVSLPGGDELARSVLRKYAPDLPVASMPTVMQEDRLRFTRRTFTLSTKDMKLLKERIVCLGEAHGAPLRRSPSSFVAVVALAWTCFVRGRAFAADEQDVFLFFFADARERLDPPAGADYFGASLIGCLARLPARELHGEGALAAAASAVQAAVQKMVEDPLGCCPGWEFFKLAGEPTVPSKRLMNVSGSPSFRAYEVADFGWGRPRRTEPIRMNHDGQLALVRARDGDGVQASVSMLQQKHLDAFKAVFLKLLG